MAHHWVLAWWKVRGWPKSYADVRSCFPCISFQTHNTVHRTQNVMTPEENNPTPNPKSCLVWHNSIFIRHPDGLVIVCSSEHLRGDNCCLDCAVTTDNRNMFTTQRAVCKKWKSNYWHKSSVSHTICLPDRNLSAEARSLLLCAFNFI